MWSRRVQRTLALLAALAAAFLLTCADTALAPEDQAAARLVARLRLTDLCLFTEARYTRHPSQADLHSPFQDHPLALEHFPSGSLLTPPIPHARLADPAASAD